LNGGVEEPVLLGPGEGEVIGDTPERFVAIKAALEQVALVEFRYGPGRSGPKRHVHRRHADCFLVLEGELVLDVGPDSERIVARAGDFALVPPGLVHTFRNDSSQPAWFLNLHAPGCNFADYLRAGGDDDFDQYEPPDDGGLAVTALVLRRAGEGEELRMGPSVVVIKSDVDVGDGWVAVMDDVLAPGFPGPLPHRHREMVDSFWVLDGELTVQLGDRETTIGPGTLALVPPGNVHTFSNRGDAPARVLNLMFPAGLEQYLKRVVAESAGGPPDPARMAEIAADYDFEPAG
jgi:mannose-6-phosphate isomerase-like protein (cupin superfamily)